jgi:hypothetical protein
VGGREPAFVIARTALALATFACFAYVLTACGGSGAAQPTTTASKRAYEQALKTLTRAVKNSSGCVLMRRDPHTRKFTAMRCKRPLSTAYFRVQVSGTAGPLRLGMTQAAAVRSLGPHAYAINQGGVNCALYDIGIGARRSFLQAFAPGCARCSIRAPGCTSAIDGFGCLVAATSL